MTLVQQLSIILASIASGWLFGMLTYALIIRSKKVKKHV